MSANPVSTKGEKRLTLEKMILKDHLTDKNIKYCWTNSGHQLADGFTKLSTAGARSDLLVSSIEQGLTQIIYSKESGRKESQQQHAREQQTMFSLDNERPNEDDQDEQAQEGVDDLLKWYNEFTVH
jgi:hypothetical protein